jgi:hypothetical protein
LKAGFVMAVALDLAQCLPIAFAMPKSLGKKKRRKAVLLGIGLDSDGHKRVTTGPNFALVGGSEETHETMTEKAIKINERLVARGKALEEVSREEFDDIAAAVGLQRHTPEGSPGK